MPERAETREVREMLAQRDSIILDLEAEIRKALNELGVPTPDYSAPLANAVRILLDALDDEALSAHYAQHGFDGEEDV